MLIKNLILKLSEFSVHNHLESPDVTEEQAVTESTSSGVIRHENYANNEELEWTISSNCHSVSIWSSSFDTERNFDFVTINHQQYSGTGGFTVTVPVGNVRVQFRSDGSVTKTGFVLLWSCAGICRG